METGRERKRERQDDYELVDKEVINVLEASGSDRGHGGAMKEKMKTGSLLIINFE